MKFKRAFFAPLFLLALSFATASCCSSSGTNVKSASTMPSSSATRAERGKVMRGQVSYYANSLAGRRTASGERYDPKAFTAASRTLPFGTRVRVTRLDNGKSVVVRVNDRGPFGHRRRILDLSRAAANELDMIKAGVVEVEAVVLD